MPIMRAASGVVLILVLSSSPAWAGLGEYESSIAKDQAALRGEVRTLSRSGYSIHEIKAGDQMVVREFVSPSGLVFAVAWHGYYLPNLQSLLGNYFIEFLNARQTSEAAHATTPGRAPLIVRTEKLVVESTGHPRSLHGRAFVPSLLPPNVSPEVVQ